MHKIYYENKLYNTNVDNWIWKQKNNSICYSFDSVAEKQWVETLVNLMVNKKEKIAKKLEYLEMVEDEYGNLTMNTEPKYIFGKNYLVNSSIKYEYYLNGIHSSYPDFIMKDHKNRIHIFEVKSVNYSSLIHLNTSEYEEKAIELVKAYKQASILTSYYFYLVVMTKDDWKIHQIFNGEDKIYSLSEFVRFIEN